MSLKIGDTVGEYKVTGVVGAGGMGEVFQVEHTITKRTEAMKVVVSGRTGAGEEGQRLLREAQIQASLNHPNIAAVHNAFWVGDSLVLVMELVKGSSLESLLEHGAVPLPDARRIACQALSALGYAHSRGVVHRDIKPANIMITSDGTVKLTDFGLAKQVSNPRLTQSGVPLGSPYYMSPEQIKGLSPLDARTDIYSLGVVLYEMTTGRKPFDSDNAFSIMQAHVECAPLAPVDIRPEIGPALSRVILTALAKNPAERFPSAESCRDALERTVSAPGKRQPAWTKLLPLRRRSRIAASLVPRIAVGLVAVMAAAILLGIWRRPSFDAEALPQAADKPSPVPSVLLTAPPDREPPRSATSDLPSRKPANFTTSAKPKSTPPKARRTAKIEGSQQEADANHPSQTQGVDGMQEDPEAKAGTNPEQPKKRRNRFWRALGRVAHPWRK